MSKKCPFPDCYAPETSCNNGEARVDDCSYWKSIAAATGTVEEQGDAKETASEFLFPWTGNALGAADLPYLTGAGPTRLLTMAGAAEAGKTSLLAAFYLLIARGITPSGASFAGSLTLEGWENIAASLRWSTHDGPSFPAHTSSGAGRHAGLLHLSFSTAKKAIELLAADAPGEWFSAWATNKQSPQAEGARWLAVGSDVFLVVADSQALSGPSRGTARKALVDLLRRVGDEVEGRPVALVWSKCDIVVPKEIVAAIRDAAGRSLVSYAEFHVSMLPSPEALDQNRGQGVIELLEWILEATPQRHQSTNIAATERETLLAFGKF